MKTDSLGVPHPAGADEERIMERVEEAIEIAYDAT